MPRSPPRQAGRARGSGSARPRADWFQSGIRHDEVAETLARAGIDVVQDRCLLVELRDRGR
ncbi:MAG: CoA-binding protein [Gemmatimonadota bacterium]